MKVSFPYEAKPSAIFKIVRRPIALVDFWSEKFNRFIRYSLIVDTGADYTLFPKSIAMDFGVDLVRDCRVYESRGIGGKEQVYLFKKRILILVGKAKRRIPIGFLDRDDIPPLLGRQECLDTFTLTFKDFTTNFVSKV